MSAIGDYIHLTYQGYADPRFKNFNILPKDYHNFGIAEAQAEKVFQQQRNRMKDLIKDRGNPATAQEIENKIQSFQGLMESDPNKQREFYQNFIRLMENDLGAIFTDYLQASPMADTPEANIKNIKEALNRIRIARDEVGGSKGSVSISKTLAVLADGVNKLNEDLSKGMVNIKKIENLEKKKQELDDYVSSYINRINELSKNKRTKNALFNISKNKSSEKSGEEEIIIKTKDGSKSITVVEFAEIVHDLTKNMSYSLYKKQGDAAELVAAAASAVGYYKANMKVEELFKNAKKDTFWKGKESGKIAYFPNEIAEKMGRELDSQRWDIDEKSGLVIARLASQNKVDVNFYLDSEKEPHPLSVKNYNYHTVKKRGFGGVSGSPFLFLAQEFRNPNFINHWINATIWHSDSAGSTSNAVLGSPSFREEAHLLMQYSLIIIGALGGVRKITSEGSIQNTDVPDYLVWNDLTAQTGKGMHVIPFSVILDNLEIRIRENWVEGYDAFLDDDWSAGRMLQEVQSAGKFLTPMQIRRRISKVLAYMHKVKITTHFFLEDSLLSKYKI